MRAALIVIFCVFQDSVSHALGNGTFEISSKGILRGDTDILTKSSGFACKNIECSLAKEPICVKLQQKRPNSKGMHVIMGNKCELEYLKCTKGIEAAIEPMKNCNTINKMRSKNMSRKKRNVHTILIDEHQKNTTIEVTKKPISKNNLRTKTQKHNIRKLDAKNPGLMKRISRQGKKTLKAVKQSQNRPVVYLNKDKEETIFTSTDEKPFFGHTSNVVVLAPNAKKRIFRKPMFKHTIFHKKEETIKGGAAKLLNEPMFKEAMFTDNQASHQQKVGAGGIFSEPIFKEAMFTDSQVSDQQRGDFAKSDNKNEYSTVRSDVESDYNKIKTDDDNKNEAINSHFSSELMSDELLEDPMFKVAIFSDNKASDQQRESERDKSVKSELDNGEKSQVSKSDGNGGSQGMNYESDRASGNVKSNGVIGSEGESSNHSMFNEEMFTENQTSDEPKGGVSGEISNDPMFSDKVLTNNQAPNQQKASESEKPFKGKTDNDEKSEGGRGSGSVIAGINKGSGGVSGEVLTDTMFSEKVLTDNQQRVSESEMPFKNKTDNCEQSGGDRGSAGVNSETNKGSDTNDKAEPAEKLESDQDSYDFETNSKEKPNTNDKAEPAEKLESDQDSYDFETNSKEKPNLPDNYEELETADEKQNQDDCPKVCPARAMMLCARCKDGVYRTFMSVCHMRKFACKHPDEKLELVARKPCAMSSPYRKIHSKGLLKEHLDVDPIQQFIRLKQSTPTRHEINQKKIAKN